MDGADSKRVLHTRLADEDDDDTAAGRVTTSCLQFLRIKRGDNFSFFWMNKRVQEAKHCSAYLHTGQRFFCMTQGSTHCEW
jgi:hypothetical protein